MSVVEHDPLPIHGPGRFRALVLDILGQQGEPLSYHAIRLYVRQYVPMTGRILAETLAQLEAHGDVEVTRIGKRGKFRRWELTERGWQWWHWFERLFRDSVIGGIREELYDV